MIRRAIALGPSAFRGGFEEITTNGHAPEKARTEMDVKEWIMETLSASDKPLPIASRHTASEFTLAARNEAASRLVAAGKIRRVAGERLSKQGPATVYFEVVK